MDSPSKTDAKLDQAVGNAKETVGDAVNNDKMKSEGAAQRGQGQINEATADLSGFVKGVKDKAEGALKGIQNAFGGNK